MNSLPGWTINIDEVSNGVFKVTLVDLYGHKVEVIDNATNETIERSKSDAFDIEKQISRNWNLFLYDLCLLNLTNKTIIKQEYKDKVFGSWYIELQDKRVVYDGRDSWLNFEVKQGREWLNIITIEKGKVNYNNFVDLVDNLNK